MSASDIPGGPDRPGSEGAGSQEPTQDFQRAVNRLESAVQDFVSAAGTTVSDRASGLVEDAAQRLEREIGSRRRRRSARRRYRRERFLSRYDYGYRTRRLYRDTDRQRVGGVCAGLARYFGVEVWVVRCLAVSGVIFMGSIVVPAYLIAWIVLEPAPGADTPFTPVSGNGDRAFNSPAPELGPTLSPRRSLRDTQADLDQLELKLRRMETHVTSGRYELQRELNRIDT